MLYDNYEKLINKIVWFLPFSKKRGNLRKIFNDILNTMYKIEYLFNENNKINKDTDNGYIIICSNDGFAGQIDKYFLGEYIKQKYGRKVKYDISWHFDVGLDMNKKEKRPFDLLNCFTELDFEIASKEESKLFKRLFYKNSGTEEIKTNDDFLKIKKHLYIEGNFKILPENMEEVLKKMDFDKYLFNKLDDNNLRIYNEMKKHNASVSIHIRRGDIEKHGGYQAFNKSDSVYKNYVLSAMALIKEKLKPINPKFFFISNDIKWVKDNIVLDIKNMYDYEFSETDNSNMIYIDMYLLSACKHSIATIGYFAPTAFIFNKNSSKILLTTENVLYNKN